MQQTLRPYVTTGVAIVGAVVIAIAPVAPQLLDGRQQFPHLQQHAVRLTAEPGDIAGSYTELFTNTVNNLQALGAHAFEFPVLSQFLSDPGGSIAHIPDVIALLTNLTPSIAVNADPLPLEVSADLPVWLSQLLAQLGPLVTVFNAMQELGAQVSGGDALAAILSAPAVLLNALLNGQDGVDVAGVNIPVFNGLLTPAQPFDVTMDMGELVNVVGIGDQTLTDLLGDLGTQPIQSLLVDALDSAGIGDLTPVELLDQMGVGQETVASLLMSLVDSTGMGDQSIAELLDQFGLGGDTTVASLLVSLLASSEIGNPTLTELLEQFGLGEATLGGLLKDLLAEDGMGSTPLTNFIDPEMTLGSLLGDMLGTSTFVDFLNDMGAGDMTMPDLTHMLFGEYGEMNLLEMIGIGWLGPVSEDTTLVDLLNTMLPPGYTFGDLLNAPEDDPYGNMTLGEMLQMFPVGDNEFGINPNLTYADIKFTELLTVAGVGDKHLSELTDNSLVSFIKDPTLNSLMGNNTVLQTLENLGQGPNLPDGMAGLTLGQLMQAMDSSVTGDTVANFQLADLLTALGNLSGNVTLGGFLTTLDFNPTLNGMVDGLLKALGLTETTLAQLFSSWGLDNLQMTTILDSLGLTNINVSSMLTSLGFNNLDLDTLIDRMGLSSIHLSTMLSNLGLDNVHLDQVINSVFGNMTLGPMLNGLGLDEVTLSSAASGLLNSVLGDKTLSALLTDLGLSTNNLNTIVTDLLAGLGWGDTTINSLLADLGIDTVDVNTVLDGVGMSDIDALNVNSGDFFGLFAEQLVHLPQQIAAALAGG